MQAQRPAPWRWVLVFSLAVFAQAGAAQAARDGYEIAKAIQDRPDAHFNHNLNLSAEAERVRLNLLALRGRTYPDARLDTIRKGAVAQTTTAAAVLAKYQKVDAERPGGGQVAFDIGKALLDTERVKNAETGEFEDKVKGDNAADALASIFQELAAQSELRDLQATYWRKCWADRELYSKLQSFEAQRTDIQRKSLDHITYGVGVSYSKSVPGPALVKTVLPDSGAAAAGLREGDRILKVNGRSVDALSTAEVAEAMTGSYKTSVKLEIGRPSADGKRVAAMTLEPKRLMLLHRDAPTLIADVNGHFNGAYRGNMLNVWNMTGKPIRNAVIFYYVVYQDTPDQTHLYMQTADRIDNERPASLEIDPPGFDPMSGRITSMTAYVYGDEVKGKDSVQYDRTQRDRDIERYLETLSFTGGVVEPWDPVFGDPEPRGFKCTITKGPAKLNPASVKVTFIKGTLRKTVSYTVKDWELGDTMTFRSPAFTFVPAEVKLEISFHDSSVTRQPAWTIK